MCAAVILAIAPCVWCISGIGIQQSFGIIDYWLGLFGCVCLYQTGFLVLTPTFIRTVWINLPARSVYWSWITEFQSTVLTNHIFKYILLLCIQCERDTQRLPATNWLSLNLVCELSPASIYVLVLTYVYTIFCTQITTFCKCRIDYVREVAVGKNIILYSGSREGAKLLQEMEILI